jgi:peptide/nickel transport system substrate-binding protein
MTRSVQTPRVGRRRFVGSLALFGAAAVAPSSALAFGRTPLAGTLRLALPFSAGGLDPHAADDPLSALLAPAIADPLYTLDAQGTPRPALASELPEQLANGARVSLRAGLTSARGKALDAKDLAFTLARARERGGVAVLAELPAPVRDPGAPLALIFPGADAKAVALALASPLTALVPRSFRPEAPDGTGAFRATVSAASLVLERNVNAARGPAFLARVEVTLGVDLSEALRAFEAERSDFGWLGAGLYRPRPGAVPFEGPSFGWVLLRAGRDAGRWSAPGVAQELLDAVPRAPLAHLGLVAPTGAVRGGAAWGGGNAELVVLQGAPQLVELATRVAAAFSVGGQQVTVRALPKGELADRRASGRYALMLDFVRNGGPPGRTTLLTLLAAANPALAQRPPNAPSYEPLDLARTLPLGVLGSLRVQGATLPRWHGLAGFSLGNVWQGGA